VVELAAIFKRMIFLEGFEKDVDAVCLLVEYAFAPNEDMTYGERVNEATRIWPIFIKQVLG
jgi:hypothetical protein